MMRFAFLGRVSTEDLQDPVASRQWQLSRAEALVADRGRIVGGVLRCRAVQVGVVGLGAVAGGVGGPGSWF